MKNDAQVESDEPQPISKEDAKRIWSLMKQKKTLSPTDQKLVHQAFEWQMWKRHGIRPKPSKENRDDNLEISDMPLERMAVS